MLLAVDLFLTLSAILVLVIMLRQMAVTLAYHFGQTRWTAPAIAFPAPLPSVSILIPAHNEEKVIDGCLAAMRQIDYPRDRLEILVVNDRSRDATGAIADRHAAEDASVRVLHRPDGALPGKPAALADAIGGMTAEAIVFFDADYIPPADLVRKLVAPLADPAIGATMGRVVPYNTDRNILTRLIDLERRAGYVVDQEARYRLGLLPQFGGTCGAVRRDALEAVGGWRTDVLAEDTDLTYRLFTNGYRVAYLDTAMCYEESPETWQVRFKQVRRWAYGHNDCLFRYFWPALTAPGQSLAARLDAAVILLFFAVPAFALISLLLVILSPAIGGVQGAALVVSPSLLAFCSIGNFAPYFQIATGCASDGQPSAFRAAPLLFLSSFISLLASAAGLAQLVRDRLLGLRPRWDKTVRFRAPGSEGAVRGD